MYLRFILLKLTYFLCEINVFEIEDKTPEIITRFNLEFLKYTIINMPRKYLFSCLDLALVVELANSPHAFQH